MFNRSSLKLGLTGAVLFVILGSASACSDEGPTGVQTVQQFTDNQNCTIIDGVIVCADGD